MATKLFFRSTQANGIGAGYFDMVAAAGSVTATGVINTAASATEIQWTQTAGGAVLQFISGRAPAGGFTLTATDISIWAAESNAQANAGGRYRVFKRAANGVETELVGGPFNDGVEFGTSTAEMAWPGNVTDTAFAENDRILLKLYITNIGAMGASRTCTLTYNGPDAATGDSFFNIAETVAFKAETLVGNVGMAAEADAALAEGSARPAGIAAEADTAPALAGKSIRAAGLANETDGAQTLAGVQLRGAGLASETEAALALGSAAPVGLAGDTETAPGLAAVQVRATGIAGEADTGFALGSARPVGLALGNGAALALPGAQIRAIGMASEEDAAQALHPGGSPVGTASETDEGLGLSAIQIGGVGASVEADIARPLGSARPTGAAIDASAAQELASVQIRAAGTADGQDTATGLGAVQIANAGLSGDASAGLALGGVAILPTGMAGEAGEAGALTSGQSGDAGRAGEGDEALPLAPVAAAGTALESDTAMAPGSKPSCPMLRGVWPKRPPRAAHGRARPGRGAAPNLQPRRAGR